MDSFSLAILRNVRDWSTAFFEATLSPPWSAHPSHYEHKKDVHDLERSTEVVRAFKLVARLIFKGYGTLAGRMARKAFLLLEDLFSLDPPALTWNLLAITYNLAATQQVQLLEMLVSHAYLLTERKFHGDHPLLALLTNLRGLMLHRISPISTCGSDTPNIPDSSSPHTTTTILDNRDADPIEESAQDMSVLLERAWMLNAELLFDRLDIRLMHIYCRLDFDSGALALTSQSLRLANQWISRIETAESSIANEAEGIWDPNVTADIGSAVRNWSLREYEYIRANTIAKVRRQLQESSSLSRANTDSDIVAQIRILGGLMTETVPGSLGPVVFQSDTGSLVLSATHIGHLAYIIRASKDLDRLRSGGHRGNAVDDIRSLQSVLDLCEYAYGETSLRVVQEMLSLQEAYSAAGNIKEAERAERAVVERIEKYTSEWRTRAMRL